MSVRPHRRPPRPRHFHKVPPGFCRLCARPVLDPSGLATDRFWHPECLSLWLFATDHRHARRVVWMRDRGVCKACGVPSPLPDGRDPAEVERMIRFGEKEALRLPLGVWQLDHVRPLVLARGDLRFWHPSNCQTLCDPCHKEKTQADLVAIRRAGGLKEAQKCVDKETVLS